MSTTATSIPTPYTGPVYVEPLFGAEADTYMRLVYGSADNSQPGITQGLFWDLRSLPLPYQPLTPTQLNVILDGTGPGTFFRVQITREHSTSVPTTDVFDFVATSTEHVISVFLGQGLNVFDVYTLDATGALKRVYSTSYTSTNYATILYSYALMITQYLWEPFNELNVALTGPGSTAMVSPLISFDSELPDSHNLFRSARQRVVSTMMNQPNSSVSVSVFGGSVFQQTPLLQKPIYETVLDLNLDWMRLIPTASQTHNTTEFHVWQTDPELARWVTYPRYLEGTGNLLQHTISHTDSVDGDIALWNSTTTEYNSQVPDRLYSCYEGTVTYADLPADVILDFTDPNNSGLIPILQG